MLNVVHISDLHFTAADEGLRSDYSRGAAKAISALVENLVRNGTIGPNPILALTGDIVQKGGASDSEVTDFCAVNEQFVKPLIATLGIPNDRVFWVPGNHELDISAVDANDRISGYKPCSKADVKRDLQAKLKTFLEFVEENEYSTIRANSPRISTFNVEGQQVACINGLAGAYSRPGLGDKGELFVLANEFIDELAVIDEFSVILMHHPISWFTDDCEGRLRAYFAERRCRLLTGHVHKTGLASVSTNDKSFVTIQAGASSDATSTGFSVAVAWLPKSNSAAVRHYEYDENLTKFPIARVDATRVEPTDARNFFERTEAFFDPALLPAAAEKLRIKCEERLCAQAALRPERFVPPDLMLFTEDQFSGKRVHLDKVTNDRGHVFLSGDELSGKSSLLMYLCYLANRPVPADEVEEIGILFDVREFSHHDQFPEFVMKRLAEVGIVQSQATYLMQIGKIRGFADNFDPSNEVTMAKFVKFLTEFPKFRWTLAARGTERFMPSRVPAALAGMDVTFYQTAETTLPTVLTLIEHHDSSTNADRPRAVVQRVFQSIQNLNAPRTLFYVNSLLDIFLNDGSIEPLNRYLLIENILSEKIRDSHRDVFPGQPVDMQMLDAFIGMVAYELWNGKKALITKAELLTFAERFIERKGLQRKRFDPDKIVDVLVRSHVLREYDAGYGFIILSIEDYYLAKYMGYDQDFADLVLSPEGLLTLPAVAEYYIAQNPNDRLRIDRIFSLIDDFQQEVAPIVAEIADSARAAIRTAAPGKASSVQEELLNDLAEIDGADEPTSLTFADPERVGKSLRFRYSFEERGAVYLQLGASLLGVTRTLDQKDRIAIFHRLRDLILLCTEAVPMIAQHLADGHEVRVRGTTFKADYVGGLAVEDDRFYIILRGMLLNLFQNFATWAGSPSFFKAAEKLREGEDDEFVSAALFAQNIQADLQEALKFVPKVSSEIESFVLKEVIVRIYLDAMTLMPLERDEEARGIDRLVDLTAELIPSRSSNAENQKRHKDNLRLNFSDRIGLNTYIGRRASARRPKGDKKP